MIQRIEVWELFTLLLIAAAWVPLLRAYAAERESAWLVAGVTALLAGRFASIVETLGETGLANLVEHGVGVGLAAVLVLGHFYREWRSARRDRSPVGGDR